MALNLIPPRVPFVDANGLLTPEAFRFFTHLFGRVGGSLGLSNDDLALVSGFDATAEVAALRAEVQELRAELAAMRDSTAIAADFKSYAAQIESRYAFDSGFQVNWASPGQIGFFTPSSGRFSLLSSALGTSAVPSIYLGADTTSGLYSTGAANFAVAISGAQVWAWGAGGASTGKPITSTVATGSAPFVVSSTTKVTNLYVDRAALADNATTANGLTSPSAYPANAIDLSTCIALANALKSAAVAKGL